MDRWSLLPAAIGLGLGAISLQAPGSADEVLEVLVIGQASLLAIVLSVSLLSVQVSTNQYAPLLSRVYRKGTFNAIMARFGVSIFVALGLRTALPLLDPTTTGVGVGVAAGLAAWSFLALFALERRLLAFLNPEPVLDELVADVSLERYRSFIRERREEGDVARNPLLEIFQIARTALDQNDNYGALRSVAALERATLKLLEELTAEPTADQHDTDEVVHRLFDYWVQIARATVDHGADDVLHALADGLESAAAFVVAEAEPPVTRQVATALVRFCEVAHDGRRLEGRYAEALEAVAASDDDVVARTVADAAVDVVADADVDAARDLLVAIVDAGHDGVVEEVLRRSDGDAVLGEELSRQLDARVVDQPDA